MPSENPFQGAVVKQIENMAADRRVSAERHQTGAVEEAYLAEALDELSTLMRMVPLNDGEALTALLMAFPQTVFGFQRQKSEIEIVRELLAGLKARDPRGELRK